MRSVSSRLSLGAIFMVKFLSGSEGNTHSKNHDLLIFIQDSLEIDLSKIEIRNKI